MPITLTPRYGHLFGGTPVIVTGPCFSDKDNIECLFGTDRSEAQFINEQSILCVSPPLNKIGVIPFTLGVKQQGEEFTFNSTYLTSKFLCSSY